MAEPLTVKEESRDGARILRAQGTLTLGQGASTLRAAVQKLVSGGTSPIVLDLRDVSHVDSAGIPQARSVAVVAQ